VRAEAAEAGPMRVAEETERGKEGDTISMHLPREVRVLRQGVGRSLQGLLGWAMTSDMGRDKDIIGPER